MAENKTPEFEPPQRRHAAIATVTAASQSPMPVSNLHEACVQRVIKAVLPDNVQIGKDAKAAFSRSAGIFIMYLTACANDFCREAKRQTISAQDVMQAIKELEFGELEEPLKEYLDQYRREVSAKKQSKALAAGSTPKKEEMGDIDEPDADADAEGEAESATNDDAEGGERETDESSQQPATGARAGAGAAAPTTATAGPVAMDESEDNGTVVAGVP